MRTILLIIVGAIIGIPLSYYFQPDLVQNFVSLPKYISNLDEIMTNTKFIDVTPTIFKSMGICAAIGGVIGFVGGKKSKS